MKIDISKALPFLGEGTYERVVAQAEAAILELEAGTCKGNDFLGWQDLPSNLTPDFLAEIKASAETLRGECDYSVVAGIGGSYLGARAVIEALQSSFAWLEETGSPRILFAGNNISEDYLGELCRLLSGKRFGIINISKSGTTTETALAFRLLRTLLEKERGKETARRVIVAITDASKGAARTTADKEGYKSFVIPDNVGGRFSVLTPVGLLPIACAGFDIDKLVAGAQAMEQATSAAVPTSENPAITYAAVRNALYREGKKIEILANYHPKLHFVAEWWKQLYGESEGKDGKGIFPAAVDLTTDLHSMGQWIQDGERTIMETVVSIEEQQQEVLFPTDAENLDGLNFLAGKRVDEVNKMAELGTQLAHVDGGVPNVRIILPRLDEETIGGLLYFFEKACGISGGILGVNTFNQPGVEAYKKNMFALLGKPGYEAESEAIRQRLGEEQAVLCCIFNYPPHYREAVYRLMDKELHPHFYFGDRVAGGQIKEMDCTQLEGYKGRFRCFTYKRKILWMSRILGLLFNRQYTCYILSNDSACLSEWLFLYLARLLGKPTYLWTHGWYGNESRWARFRNIAFYRPVRGLLLYGDYARQLLLEQGVPENKLHVIANSLDYDRQLAIRTTLKQTNIYQSLFGNDRPTLLFIGRLTAVKRLDMIIQSARQLINRGRPVNVAIVGSGPEQARLMQQIEEYNLSGSIRLLGACYDEQLNAQYIHNADLCISPGNVGLTAIHSLSYGTPVITHNNFSLQMPEFQAINDGTTGAFFVYGSVESLTATIEQWLARHPHKDSATIEACYRTIDTTYNPHYQLAVLKRVLSPKQ